MLRGDESPLLGIKQQVKKRRIVAFPRAIHHWQIVTPGSWHGACYLAKRYRFSEKEALLLAASTGLLYELVGSGAIFRFPAGLLLMAPLDIVVYAALFVLPMQLVGFSGETAGRAKYLVAPILPYLLAWPVAALFLLVM